MRPERIQGAGSLALRRLAPGALALLLLLMLRTGASPAALSPASSVDRSYTAQSFAQELRRLKAGLEDARKSPEALRAYRQSLPKTWSVDAGGRHCDVPSDLLASRLNKAEKQPELREQQISQANDYLDALAAETEALSGRSQASADSARAKLNAILARSEYAQVRQESWWDKIRARIDEILSDALDRILRRVGGQASFGYALLWIGLVAAVALIAFWIVRQWSRRARGEEMDLQAAAALARSWQEWVFAARDAAGRGDYRLAIHCAYWAGITRLQDLGALVPDRAKTPREYLRALAKSKLLVPETLAPRQLALSMLTARLEKTWYGYQAATEADFRDSLTQLETLGCHLP
ncbi:MAG TPA: hypothetical protein VNZ56_09340 [Verrucomicrobiae bacterium]|nr:hypothetical protein [Verrucomicrobiae bacterium]